MILLQTCKGKNGMDDEVLAIWHCATLLLCRVLLRCLFQSKDCVILLAHHNGQLCDNCRCQSIHHPCIPSWSYLENWAR